MDKKIESASRNPYLFVVGCPRSGTTLLQRMLDNHPQLAVVNDSHFIPLAIEGITSETNPNLTSNLVDWVRTYRRTARLGLPDAVFREAAAMADTYGEFVSALYSEYGRLRRKPLAGEKTPDYVRYLLLLHSLFPWVRTIHLIRDGRDVALSTLEWPREGRKPRTFKLWQEEPIAVCALWWGWQVGTGRRDGEDLGPDRYIEVKYEDLVVRPGEILQGITTFLKLPFASEMLAYYAGRTRYETGLSAKKAWLPPTQGLRDWRTQMTERDVELFEAISGDLLSALDYERVFSTFSPAITAVAERCKGWWESWLSRRKARPGKSM